jgi:peptidoglycan/xylan/chitin deacetylase (PgdA/CDA1 family)
VTAVSPARVPVLMYHEIAEVSEAGSRLAVSPAAFAAQLGYLRSAGFTAITASELSAGLAGDLGKLPDRPVVLTFDDGYADFHGRAMPLLDQYGCTATLFVTTGWVQDADMRLADPGRMLNATQITEAAGAGVEIGAHTRRHPQLDQLPQRLVREELHASKQWLESKLGLPVPGLAYPFGYSSAKVREVAREAGYGYACGVGHRMASPASDLLELPRLTVRQATTMPAFRRLVDGHTTMRLLEDRALTASWAGVRRVRAMANTAPACAQLRFR